MAAGLSAAIAIPSFLATAGPASAADAVPPLVGVACAPASAGVTVAVDFSPVIDTVDVACVTPTAGMSADQAFAAAGFALDDPSYVTAIDSVTAAWPQAYWALYTSVAGGNPGGGAGGDWASANAGVSAFSVSAGQAYLFEYQPVLDPDAFTVGKASPVYTLAQLTGQTTAAVPAPPSYGPGNANAQAAATWLARQLAANGDVLSYNGSTSWGLTAQAVLALASAGVGGDQIAATAAKIANSGTAYVGTPAQASSNTGAIANVVFALEVAGMDPTHFGSGAGQRDLVAELRSTLQSSGAFGTASPSAYTQALAVLALARSAAGVPASAITWLQTQQCTTATDPNAGAYGWSASCGSADQDTTALVAQALLAAGVPATDPSVADAQAWLVAQQQSSGGLASSLGGVNANTTGIAAQLFTGMGDVKPAASAGGYLGGLQVTCGLVAAHPALKAADVGAIAYDASGLSDATTYGIDSASLNQVQQATSQAILGLGGPLMGDLTAAGASALPTTSCAATPTAKPTAKHSTTATPATPAKPGTKSTPSAAAVTASSGGKASIQTGGTTVTSTAAAATAVVLIALAGVVAVVRRRAIGH